MNKINFPNGDGWSVTPIVAGYALYVRGCKCAVASRGKQLYWYQVTFEIEHDIPPPARAEINFILDIIMGAQMDEAQRVRREIENQVSPDRDVAIRRAEIRREAIKTAFPSAFSGDGCDF